MNFEKKRWWSFFRYMWRILHLCFHRFSFLLFYQNIFSFISVLSVFICRKKLIFYSFGQKKAKLIFFSLCVCFFLEIKIFRFFCCCNERDEAPISIFFSLISLLLLLINILAIHLKTNPGSQSNPSIHSNGWMDGWMAHIHTYRGLVIVIVKKKQTVDVK